MDRTTELVAQLPAITAELGDIHGRRFTPDRHLAGTLGEVLAASMVAPPSTKGFDAVDRETSTSIRGCSASSNMNIESRQLGVHPRGLRAQNRRSQAAASGRRAPGAVVQNTEARS